MKLRTQGKELRFLTQVWNYRITPFPWWMGFNAPTSTEDIWGSEGERSSARGTSCWEKYGCGKGKIEEKSCFRDLQRRGGVKQSWERAETQETGL